MTTTAHPSFAESAAAAAGPPAPLAWTLAALALCTLLPSLGIGVANVALPALAQALGATFQQVQWVVVAYLIANTALVVLVGRLGDRWGRRRTLMGGLLLFSAASALCGLAPTLAWLIAARALQGLGAATLMALAMALVAQAVPQGQTGRAMGLLGTMSAVGTALGPTLGGLLVAALGWRAVFLAGVPLGLAALWLVRRALPADDTHDAVAPAAARAGFAGSLRRPAVAAGLVMSALVASVMMATLVVGPFHLAGALGLGAAGVGLVMSAGPVVAALAGVPAGRLVDRVGAPPATALGLAAIGAGCAGLALAPAPWGVAGYVGPLVVATAGYALFQAANNTALMAHAAAAERGAVAGLLNLARNLGLLAGASLMGAVFARGAGVADVAAARPEAVAAGMRFTFGVAAGLMIGALAIAAAAGRASAPRAAR